MARTKLTAEARAQIVDGYRQPGVTVSMLAEQFGISSSTASRVLKEDIPTDEYKVLVRQKRGGRPSKKKQAAQPSLLDIDSGAAIAEEIETDGISAAALDDTESAIDVDDSELETDDIDGASIDDALEGEVLGGGEREDDELDDDELDEDSEDDEQLGAELFGDDDSEDEYDSDIDDEGEDDDSEDDDDDEGDGKWDEQPSQVEVVGPPPVWYSAVQANPDFSAPTQQDPINILALDEEDLPGQCFAVVDRFQELTTCLLQEFNHLGDVPNELAEAKTLPLFDSHRVARRFSDRFRHRGRHKHRVIGFPSYFLSAAREQLQEKGITHLLLDNQVYEL
ncbi:MAG: hypothetical protein AB4050_08660 [Synechococcus sp.]